MKTYYLVALSFSVCLFSQSCLSGDAEITLKDRTGIHVKREIKAPDTVPNRVNKGSRGEATPVDALQVINHTNSSGKSKGGNVETTWKVEKGEK